MEELIKKLKDAGKMEAIKSGEELFAAAKELGYSDEDLKKMSTEVPLDDDALDQVAGGTAYDYDPDEIIDFGVGVPKTQREIRKELADYMTKYC